MDDNPARKELKTARQSEPQQPPTINTEGGAVVQGNVAVQGGDFAGRDLYKTVISEEASYEVAGLPNPFLGLRAFSYGDRAAFGGRERAIEEAVAKLCDPASKMTLFFITGSSGSGKSSFAQAGLLPALEAHYGARHKQVSRALFRPSSDPVAMLADALGLLGLPDLSAQELTRFTPEEFASFLSKNTPKDQVNLLIIDQFEEFFTQSGPGQREAVFRFLAKLPAFSEGRTHIIATLRSDFLDELFKNKDLWDISKQGIELRAMSKEEMQAAIQQPLFAACKGGEDGRKSDERYCQKRFDPELLARLAEDASQESAYLPLLQVTLQEIWNKGSLRPGEYSNLTTAIQERAEAVYQFEDYSSSHPAKERLPQEKAALLDIFLDLVDVSLDSDVRRDVRRRRAKAELVSASDLRPRLVDDLIEARLLSASTEAGAAGHVEVVDIIHESLIANWERLRKAITENRQVLRRRARFEELLAEWLESNRSDDYVLTGVRLAEARELEKLDDIAARRPEARDFLRRSILLAEAVQRQKFRRTLYFSIGLSIALVIAIITAVIALQKTNLARQQEALSRARELASSSVALIGTDPALALKLAVLSFDTANTLQGRDALRRSILLPPVKLMLTGQSGAVYSVEYDHKGLRLLTSGADGTVRIWDSATGKQLIMFSADRNPVLSAAFSPDDLLVATGSADGTARIWDVSTGQQLRKLSGHTAAINSVAFSPDGKRIITASDDNTARVWETATGRQSHAFPQEAKVRAAAFSPDGDLIATGGYDAKISIWNAATMELMEQLPNSPEVVNSIAFSHDSQYVFADSLYSVIRWNIQSGAYEASYQGQHNWYLTDVAVSQDDRFLATASRDHTVGLSERESGTEFLTLLGHSDVVNSVAFDPSGDHLATASSDQTVRIWDLKEWRKRTLLTGQGPSLINQAGIYTNAAYSNDGSRIATTASDGWLRIWDAQSGTELKSWQYPGWFASRLAFSPDDKQLITASDDGTWRIWNIEAGEQVYQSDYRNIVHDARFSPDGSRALITGRPNFAEIWDLSTDPPQLVASLEGHMDWVASGRFSPDGLLAVTAGADRTARLWDARTGYPLRVLSGHSEVVVKAAFSSDAKRVVTASVDGTARIWDTATGKTLLVLKGHTAQLSDAVFSPDDRFVVTASADNTVRVWDAATGSEVSQLIGHVMPVIGLSFSRDGRNLIAASWDGSGRIYPVEIEDVIAIARANLTNRDFTCAEKIRYLHEEGACPTATASTSEQP